MAFYTEGGIVWDNHSCMPFDKSMDHYLPMLAKCHAAGVDVISLNIGMDANSASEHIATLSAYRSWLRDRPDHYVLVSGVDDIIQARRQEKLAVCFDMEGTNALAGQTDMVSLYYDLGVRWMLIAYNFANAAGGGCLDPVDGGLTTYGRAIIHEMNRVGMVVCASHAGCRTAREIIDLSKDPVIFSHSNSLAIWKHPRNISDELIKACAERGGVIGLNGFGPFLGPNDASIETFIRHMEYVIDLVGDDSIGISLDYVFNKDEMIDFIIRTPNSFLSELGITENVAMIEHRSFSKIAESLVRRGYSTMTLKKIFGGNFLRVAQDVWRP